MITRIREVRRARRLTLDDVARRCDPPTTAQTIGRLETGTRTVSVGWLNRIAKALGVEAEDLVGGGARVELNVAAVIGAVAAPGDHCQCRPEREPADAPPRPDEEQIAVLVSGSIGDYRAGDELWCQSLDPGDYGKALNRDVLVPRPSGRFLFGRMINRDEEKVQILPLEPGGRQQVVANPRWLAVVTKLVRTL